MESRFLSSDSNMHKDVLFLGLDCYDNENFYILNLNHLSFKMPQRLSDRE